MQNFSDDINMRKAMELAGSPAGQQLLALLQKNGGAEFQQAMAKAALGDYDAAKQALISVMNTPEAKQLLEQLGR